MAITQEVLVSREYNGKAAMVFPTAIPLSADRLVMSIDRANLPKAVQSKACKAQVMLSFDGGKTFDRGAHVVLDTGDYRDSRTNQITTESTLSIRLPQVGNPERMAFVDLDAAIPITTKISLTFLP